MQSSASPPKLRIALDHFKNFYEVNFYVKAYLGVVQYARENSNWQIYFNDPNLFSACHNYIKFDDLKKQGFAGVIFSWQEDFVYEQIVSSGIPAVNIRGRVYDKRIPAVWVNNRAVGRMAAEHFLTQGFRNFGYCGPRDWEWSVLRNQGFEETLQKAGYSCSIFNPPFANEKNARRKFSTKEWRTPQILHAWLKSIPKPAAIFACNDRRAIYVLDTCQEYGIPVPDEVAVLGADNDEILCSTATPNLSSVELNQERVGYEAAALLNRMILGKHPKTIYQEFEPRGVRMRRSTSLLAVNDPIVAKAQMFIHDHIVEPIGIPDLINHCHLSRSALERKFRENLGHTMVDEIRRRRLEKAQFLLAETNLSLGEIALETGFHSSSYLINVFKTAFGISPSSWRSTQKANATRA